MTDLPAMRMDWETESDIDINKRGAYVYSESPYADALIASYKIGDGPSRRWQKGEPCPADIRAHVEAGGEIKALNAAFERLIWWNIMVPRYGWPKPALGQFRCTAVAAAAMSLPRSLERLGDALGLDVKKDKRGKALMKIHSIPVGLAADGSPIWHEKKNDPVSLEEYKVYCDFDVLSEEAADKRLIPLSDYEQRAYALNETINDRGVRIDVRSAHAAIRMTAKVEQNLASELKRLTGGEVTAVTQVAALTRWLSTQGFEFDGLDKDTLEEFLFEFDDIPPTVRRVLEIRLEGAKSSIKKIVAMLDRVSADGRARGTYVAHGAGQTGRYSARGLQLHNMPKYRKSFEKAVENGLSFETLFQVLRTADPDYVEFMYGSEVGQPLHLLADATRSFIWAAPGHRLIDVDYSSIEGRMAAWFAREDWKLDAFRQLDRGEGYGIYELAAAGIYGVDVADVTKAQRPTGKVAELSCQYQTGVGGIKKFARQAKIKLGTLYPALWEAADLDQREFVEKRFADRVAAHDANCELLGREGWIAAELIKTGWRGRHPGIVAAWSLLEEAATEAVRSVEDEVDILRATYLRQGLSEAAAESKARKEGPQTGSIMSVMGVKYTVAHGFLWCQLPSGRCLAYGVPRMRETEAPWADKTVEPAKREKKMSLTVRGTDAQTEKWIRFPVYGGSLFNNVVQGSARDILVHGMFNAEAAGYPIVLHTHDEMAAELPYGVGSWQELAAVAAQLPAWATDLPLTADGFESKRYRKD